MACLCLRLWLLLRLLLLRLGLFRGRRVVSRRRSRSGDAGLTMAKARIVSHPGLHLSPRLLEEGGSSRRHMDTTRRDGTGRGGAGSTGAVARTDKMIRLCCLLLFTRGWKGEGLGYAFMRLSMVTVLVWGTCTCPRQGPCSYVPVCVGMLLEPEQSIRIGWTRGSGLIVMYHVSNRPNSPARLGRNMH